MNVRAFIDKHKERAVIVAVGVLVAAGVGAWWTLSSGSGSYTANTFYSKDDGASYFGGEGSDIYEYELGSPPAYKAAVYASPDGSAPFVAYLMRHQKDDIQAYTDAQTKLDAARKNPPKESAALVPVIKTAEVASKRLSDRIEVKRPGSSSKWVSASSPEGREVTTKIKSPTGSTNVQVVLP